MPLAALDSVVWVFGLVCFVLVVGLVLVMYLGIWDGLCNIAFRFL